MSKTKIILETETENNPYEPHLFIFKNESAIMLTESEIQELKEIIKDI